MLPFPDELVFHHEHTWVRREEHELGVRYRIGVDELFLMQIGSVELLDLPHEGDEISQDEVCGLIRGKDTKKLLYAPLSGEIIDVNLELHEDPDIIREDPYGVGWLILIDPNDPGEELEYLIGGAEAEEWWMSERKLISGKQ